MDGIFFYVEYFSGRHSLLWFNPKMVSLASNSDFIGLIPEKYEKILAHIQ
jgi:hypothetical protein